MSVILTTPYPYINVSSILPNPKFDDSKAPELGVLVHRSMTGVLYTYVRKGERRIMSLPFVLTRMKALELQEVFRVYHAAPWSVTLHDGSVWIGELVNNPFAYNSADRAGGWPGGETVEVTLQFSVYPQAQLIE